ncbi:baseplate J/gp47 family protein [Chromobacterium haemolyticum]|uniref:Baseplate J/gp47 family protein n=1 Tax=Chromobacterium fluminis TaxID=3044269 RepID=A0ABX0LB48_9NEIS|nr:baseplate J/gp47 family protein [Chromobacterium haemolyticum]NHR08000.1 baseplate J/gp47 family protein [Chromobacterium haemolyticum]
MDAPNLPQLVDAARRDLLAMGLDGLRRADAEVYSRMVAGGVHGLYGYLDWHARQLFAESCDDEALLGHHGPFWLGQGRTPAAAAAGWVRVRGAPDAPIPAESRFQSESGVLLVVPVGAVLPAAGVLDVRMVAIEPGAAGNLKPGARVDSVQPLPRVESSALVIGDGVVGGADIEPIESYRARVLAVKRRDGETGRPEDFEVWAKEVPGVTRAWCAPRWPGPGQVAVFFVRDGDVDGPLPSPSEVAAVTTHLEETGTAYGEPSGAAPVDKPVAVRLSISPDTPEMRVAVLARLDALFAARAAPLDRERLAAGLTRGVTLRRSWFADAVSAAGVEFYTVTEPAADVACRVGELARRGEVAWS